MSLLTKSSYAKHRILRGKDTTFPWIFQELFRNYEKIISRLVETVPPGQLACLSSAV